MLGGNKYCVSSDCTGILGQPTDWKKTWGFLLDEPDFAGWEMIAWGGPLIAYTGYLISQAKKLGLPIAGFHGRIGDVKQVAEVTRRATLSLLNQMILPVDKMAELITPEQYMLIHVNVLNNKDAVDQVIANRGNIGQLFVENVLGKPSLNDALEKAKFLRTKGIEAGLMFDLYHYIKEDSDKGNVKGSFKELINVIDHLSQTKDFKGKDLPISFHIPVGTNLFDSLPVEKINNDMWKELGKVIRNIKNHHIVIENQQPGLGAVLPWRLSEQRERNKRIIDLFRRTKVI